MTLLTLLRFICDHPLNRKSKARAVFDFARWQMLSRLSRPPIIYEWINGTKLAVRRGDTGFTFNIYCGLQDFAEMGYLLHVLRAGDLFVDVGANIGSYTLLASSVRRAKSVSFEPVPETFARLEQNLQLNHLGDLVSAQNRGVGEASGLIRFSQFENCCNRVLRDDELEKGIEVKVVTLDEMLAGASPSLLKIDVEGFELPVLRGAEKTLQNPSLHSIVLELTNAGSHYGFEESDILALLKRHGFASYAYDPFSRKLTPQEPTSYNVLFIRDLPRVEALVCASESFEVKGVKL